VTLKFFDDSSSWNAATNTVLDMQNTHFFLSYVPCIGRVLKAAWSAKVVHNVHRRYTFRTNYHSPIGNS